MLLRARAGVQCLGADGVRIFVHFNSCAVVDADVARAIKTMGSIETARFVFQLLNSIKRKAWTCNEQESRVKYTATFFNRMTR